jgi:alpha-glucoside transport system substrate-binding protein
VLKSRPFSARIGAILTAAALIAVACTSPGESPSPQPTGTGPAPTGAPTGTPSATQLGGSISIVASWTGSEEDSFRAMIKPWEDATGVTVNYTGSRSLSDDLTAAIQAGGAGLPDVAGIPGPGLAQEWFDAGALKALDFVDLSQYRSDSPLADIGVYKDKLIGIFSKAAVKGLIWYNKSNYDGTVPANWDALEATDPAPASSLWCNAFESGAASGWPGTDWIEDFVIRQSGPDVYDSWVAGQTKWTSPEIKAAFTAMADVINKSDGGGTKINATNFGDVGNGLGFTGAATCKFVHQASFISDFFVNNSGATAGDFDFFVMPDINPSYAGALTGGGDMFGMFNDTPQARSFIQYMLTADAQAIWAARGGFIAANKNVPASAYKDDSDRKAGEAVAHASAFRFDGSDQMPGAMNDAFFTAMVNLAANPDNIDSILQQLDSVQADAYAH